jgi:hypothetical protein
MGRVRAFARKRSLPQLVHTKVREIAVRASLRIQMDVSQYLLFTTGLSTVLKLVRGVIVGPIITGSPGEGLAP